MNYEHTPPFADLVSITAVTGLNAEQVAAISAPFDPRKKAAAVATLEAFTVTCDFSAYEAAANLQGPYVFADYRAFDTRLYVYVWVKGNAANYAALSYKPAPGYKAGLWRLAPDVTGGSADDSNVVNLTLPRAAPVVSLAPILRGRIVP